jgi:comEA protein
MKFLRSIFVFTFAIVAIFFVSGVVSNDVALAAVNINTASLVDLETIPGVGPAIGQRIIDYRTANGPFTKIDDIVNVKGIGPTTFAKMSAYITVEGSSNPVAPSSPDPDDESDDTSDGEDGGDDSDESGGDDDSVHYEQEGLSNYEETVSDFKVSAGRERVSYVGSPVSFEAKYKISGEEKNKKLDCTWSFGDGAVSDEEDVVHIYKYPGEYNVVLNASFDDVNSVSRTVVKVLTPNLTLTVLNNEAVEIANKGANEINLYSWKLQSGNIAYAFPLDTIISAGKSVTFPVEFLKIPVVGVQIILADASGKGIAQFGSAGIMMSAADFEKFALAFKNVSTSQYTEPARQLGRLTAPTNVVLATSTSSAVSEEYWSDHYVKVTNQVLGTSSKKVETAEAEDEEDENSTARSDLAVPEVSEPGFWGKLFHPVRTIKETFYE